MIKLGPIKKTPCEICGRSTKSIRYFGRLGWICHCENHTDEELKQSCDKKD